MNYDAMVRKALEEARKVLASRTLEEWERDLVTFNRLKAQVADAERYFKQRGIKPDGDRNGNRQHR